MARLSLLAAALAAAPTLAAADRPAACQGLDAQAEAILSMSFDTIEALRDAANDQLTRRRACDAAWLQACGASQTHEACLSAFASDARARMATLRQDVAERASLGGFDAPRLEAQAGQVDHQIQTVCHDIGPREAITELFAQHPDLLAPACEAEVLYSFSGYFEWHVVVETVRAQQSIAN